MYHGLEPPEERRAAGKPELGTVRLNAYHDGGSICISVEDDGRGLNRQKILAKALEKGLIAEGQQMTDEEVWLLIFRPGFSTADKITDISGRGVGMDVVKRNIEALGGSVGIQSTEGKGSILTLKLPLTLAIIDGMTVRVAEKQLYHPAPFRYRVDSSEAGRPTNHGRQRRSRQSTWRVGANGEALRCLWCSTGIH